MGRITISLDIDSLDLARLDEYAANLERDRNYVLNQAVRMYIAAAKREKAENEAAMRGPFCSPGEVAERLRSHFAERRAAQRATGGLG
jgi:predicted transcriptional regulator